MKHYYLFIILCMLTLVVSCQSDIEIATIDNTPASNSTISTVNYQRTREGAIAMVNNLKGLSTTRSAGQLSYTVEPIMSASAPTSNGDLVDTIAYLVNSEEHAEAYIVSGDTRINEFYLICENGTLNLDSIDVNSGLNVFLSRLPKYYQSEIDLYNGGSYEGGAEVVPEKPEIPDIFLDPYPETASPYEHSYSPWVTIDSVAPFILYNWTDSVPYSNIRTTLDDKIPTMFYSALAVGQILAYYQQPSIVNGINWDYLSAVPSYYDIIDEESLEYYAEDASDLIEYLCSSLVPRYWRLEDTGLNFNKIPSLFDNLGYSSPSSVTDYVSSSVINSLQQLRPVLLYGKTESDSLVYNLRNNQYYTVESGYVWLVDGYKYMESTLTMTSLWPETYPDKILQVSNTMLHCKWGCESDDQRSYYLKAEVFNNNTDPKTGTKLFEEDVKCITHIHP